ncbi:MAG TPA: hypothetical protein VH442_21060 [Micromonosporaceae bacterium]
MSQGGYRDERDEWLESLRPQSPSATRRPRHGVTDESYDSDDPVPAYRTRPTDHFVPASDPRESGSAYGGPWYGRRPSGSPYGNRPEPPQQRYPDAYVADSPGYAPRTYEPNGDRPRGRVAEPNGDPRARRAPGAYPPPRYAPNDIRAGGRAAFADTDVRTTGQQPIFGPDERRGDGRHSHAADTRPVGTAPWVTGQQPRTPSVDPRAYSADARSTGTQDRIGDARSTGAQPRIGAGPRATGSPGRVSGEPGRVSGEPWTTGMQGRIGGDPRTGTQARVAADPWTTGAQARATEPWMTGTQGRVAVDTTGSHGSVADGWRTGSIAPVDAPRPGRRRGRGLVIAISVILVLAALGTAGSMLLRDRKTPSHTTASTTSTTTSGSNESTSGAALIDSRKTDAKPLSVAEVFGGKTIKPSSTTYQVLTSDIATTCANAVTAPISTLLASLGCNQAVRATMVSADQAYVITAGVLNLPDAQAAENAAGSIKSDLAAGKGRFNGLAGGGTTDVIATAQAQVAWDTRGHYLVYCVIALANGKVISADDQKVPTIVDDVIEKYLAGTVLGERANPATSGH